MKRGLISLSKPCEVAVMRRGMTKELRPGKISRLSFGKLFGSARDDFGGQSGVLNNPVYVLWEFGLATSNGRRRIPLMIVGVQAKQLPSVMNNFQAIWGSDPGNAARRSRRAVGDPIARSASRFVPSCEDF